MTSEPTYLSETQRSGELSVGELLRRARPLPPRGEMIIDDLTDDEAAAFIANLEA